MEPGLILGEVNRLLVGYKQKHNLPVQYKMVGRCSLTPGC